jgi:DNA-binding NarL/FixJ family response regulator
MKIRVLLADDQALLRSTFRLLIDSTPDMEVVGEAGNGREAVDLARTERADIVLMDVRMPLMDGVEATRRLSADEDLDGVRVLVLTTFEEDEVVLDALRAGASGFLGKGVAATDLLAAIRTVAAGEQLLSSAATRALIERVMSQPAPRSARPVPGMDELTPREREIVALVGRGMSNSEIAEYLFISPATAKTHVGRSMLKTHARDRAQLVVFAYEAGLVAP